MSDEIRKLLDEEIEAELVNISSLEPGSVDKTKEIDNLVKLYNLRIEESKHKLDFLEKRDGSAIRGLEQDLKRDQLDEQVKDRYFKLGVEAAAIIVPMIFYATWMNRGFKFEETGIYTSTTFRGLFNRFRPTK